MCNCSKQTCPSCDPGIEAFYQKKVEIAKAAVIAAKAQGFKMHYEDLLDAKDIWYEYCALRDQELQEHLEGESFSIQSLNIENPNSWE